MGKEDLHITNLAVAPVADINTGIVTLHISPEDWQNLLRYAEQMYVTVHLEDALFRNRVNLAIGTHIHLRTFPNEGVSPLPIVVKEIWRTGKGLSLLCVRAPVSPVLFGIIYAMTKNVTGFAIIDAGNWRSIPEEAMFVNMSGVSVQEGCYIQVRNGAERHLYKVIKLEPDISMYKAEYDIPGTSYDGLVLKRV